ncbi:MAG TPA: heliorhodopsin HeR [Candidatus Saccharimonadales bacterium]|nr:heliorhodopsin HeR [Candidatus Saccharimonadales bacterium]
MARERGKRIKQIGSQAEYKSLHNWNRWLAVIHAVQGIAIALIGIAYALPVTASYLTIDPIATATVGHPVLTTATRQLFYVDLISLVVIFFFASAIAHGLSATIYRRRYELDLSRAMNKLRWFEYAVSASVMIVAIGLLSGVYDLTSLFMLFMLVALMNLCGLAMEVYNQRNASPNWLVYWLGCLAGIVPWIVLIFYLFATNFYGSGHIPGFVYGIYGSMFICFNSFAVNMYLQYKKKGRWANYLYGEKGYMILSLVAKTLLAWQVFFGVLRP